MKRAILFGWLHVVAGLLCFSAIGQNVISLAGKWSVKLDSLNKGEAEGWFKNKFETGRLYIQLPGTLDEAGYGTPVEIKPVLQRQVMLHLWRKVSYVGAAWYQREIAIPAGWMGRQVILELERTIWKSNVWVDGKPVSTTGESLVSPHRFDLSGILSTGKHLITIRIDNSKQFDISLGDQNFAHAYTNETQTIWNGVVGKLQLVALPVNHIDDIQVFPSFASKSFRITGTLSNPSGAAVTIQFSLVSVLTGKPVKLLSPYITLKDGQQSFDTNLAVSGAVEQWDEFNPALYTLKAAIKGAVGAGSYAINFGFRNIGNTNAKLSVNGRKLFLRGTLECNIFPRLGHTPADEASWLKVFSTAKEYGLNHLRFHSWCPPEAAFAIADKLGFYLQIELPVWTLKIGQDSAADMFLQREALRIISAYGNHPSFCFFSMGNEMQGNINWLAREVKILKEKDTRRLYTTTTFTFENGYGKWPVPADDYFVTQYTNKGWVRGQGIFDTDPPTFNKDYSTAVDSLPVPIISHEIGQYAVYPDLREIEKYTGVLRPVNLIAIRNSLEQKNMLPHANEFTQASGKLATLLYKEEIERALKTNAFSGFQLLDLHDFPGQGTADVGILNAFWESKGLITAREFREFCAPVVPLVRFGKATYFNTDTFTAQVEVANFSKAAINKAVIAWSLKAGDKSLHSGSINAALIAVGNSVAIGNIKVALSKIKTAEQLTLEVAIAGTPYKNSWHLWVYPNENNADQSAVVFTTSVSEAKSLLQAGKTVLFNPPTEDINGVEGKFVPVFWSPVHFPDQPGTMGLSLNAAHPAFAKFPTSNYTDWQWWDLCKHSKTLVLDSIGISPATIVLRNIDNFFKNRNMASIIECKVGLGKMLVCTMDLHTGLSQRPAALQLRKSLTTYMAGSQFQPDITLSEMILDKILK